MRQNNMYNFFIPRGTTPIGIEAIDAAVAVHGGMLCIRKCKVTRLMFYEETLVVATTTAPAVEFNRRPTVGSSAGEVLCGTLTIPDATPIGEVIFKDIDPVVFYVGDELSFEHTVQCVGGTVAGDGYYAVECEDMPEEDGNMSHMTASA